VLERWPFSWPLSRPLPSACPSSVTACRKGSRTRQRTGFESGLEELDSTIASIKGKAVNHETVLAALSRFKDIYAKLPPYQRRELIGLVLLRAEVTENQLRLSFGGSDAVCVRLQASPFPLRPYNGTLTSSAA